MSQSLSLKLSDEAFAALLRQAEASGTSPARLAAASLEQRFGGTSQPSDAAANEARERFEQHFGEISGRSSGAINDDIDRDLGREYADTHAAATDPFVDTVQRLARPRTHLPKDYALNHGHYVRGEPKK